MLGFMSVINSFPSYILKLTALFIRVVQLVVLFAQLLQIVLMFY